MNWVEIPRIEEILDGAVEVANVVVVDDSLYLDFSWPCGLCFGRGWTSCPDEDCETCSGSKVEWTCEVECTESEFALAVQWAVAHRSGKRAAIAQMVLIASKHAVTARAA